MFRDVLAAFVVLATSMYMQTISAQPDLNALCALLPSAICIPQVECEGNGQGVAIFQCSEDGQVCCRTKPSCGDRRLPLGYSEACIAEAECGDNSRIDDFPQCSTAGEVCCVTSITSCEAIQPQTGISVACVPEGECNAIGPRNNFECLTTGDVCCVTGTPAGRPRGPPILLPGGPRPFQPIPGPRIQPSELGDLPLPDVSTGRYGTHSSHYFHTDLNSYGSDLWSNPFILASYISMCV